MDTVFRLHQISQNIFLSIFYASCNFSWTQSESLDWKCRFFQLPAQSRRNSRRCWKRTLIENVPAKSSLNYGWIPGLGNAEESGEFGVTFDGRGTCFHDVTESIRAPESDCEPGVDVIGDTFACWPCLGWKRGYRAVSWAELVPVMQFAKCTAFNHTEETRLLPSSFVSLHSSVKICGGEGFSRVAVPTRPPSLLPSRFLYFIFIFLYVSTFHSYISLCIYILYL